ncbi:MAG TPA: L,D-transpeptidase [Thermoanaerobaculia bacterium]|nr:L,D-transpeptidase [Thermoanaerobaculia bacterium]
MNHSNRIVLAALALGALCSLLVLPLAAETAAGWEPDAVAAAEPELPLAESASGPAMFGLQWRLDRLGFSPGVLDGMWGANTEAALAAFQGANGLPANGELDAASWKALAGAVGDAEPLVSHQLTAADLGGDEAPPADGYSIPEEPVAQAELDCLCFESISEALAERFHTTPDFLAQLNPGADLDAASAGDRLVVPNVAGEPAEKSAEIDHLVISKQGFYLRAVDAEGNVVYHFPTTVGDGYDPSPDGEFEVTAVAPDPTFHYQPKLFADVSNDEQDAVLPPGPNSPVGVVWMQLSKENYGIHGTAEPSTIGHSTSHGCIRMTNWDARFLADRIGEGTPVRFVGGEPDAETASERGLDDEQAEKAKKVEEAASTEPGDDA